MSLIARLRTKSAGLTTEPLWVGTALGAGALAGAGLTGLMVMATGISGGVVGLCLMIIPAIFSSMLALAVWSAGLLATAPLWLALHALGFRCWAVAIGIGAILAAVPVLAPGVFWLTDGLTKQLLVFAAWNAAAGAVVGLVVWKVAYRQVIWPGFARQTAS